MFSYFTADCMIDEVSPELEAEWHQIWDSVGVARVAEELVSPAMGKLVDDIQSKVDKRKYARAWLAETLHREKNERHWTNARSWIAIVLSVFSLITAMLR
jgi:hypothetical protein